MSRRVRYPNIQYPPRGPTSSCSLLSGIYPGLVFPAMAREEKSITGSVDGKISYQYASGGVEEILRPTLVVSGGRSYRKLTDIEFGKRPNDRKNRAGRRGRGKERSEELREGEETSPQFSQPEEGVEEPGGRQMGLRSAAYTDDVYDEGEDNEEELTGIEKLRSGNYQLKLHIPSTFFKYIIGKEGKTKNGIERDTECHLWLPSKGKEGDVGKHCEDCLCICI